MLETGRRKITRLLVVLRAAFQAGTSLLRNFILEPSRRRPTEIDGESTRTCDIRFAAIEYSKVWE
jgi:hypothetical protein